MRPPTPQQEHCIDDDIRTKRAHFVLLCFGLLALELAMVAASCYFSLSASDGGDDRYVREDGGGGERTSYYVAPLRVGERSRSPPEARRQETERHSARGGAAAAREMQVGPRAVAS
jgi:hypothetical protein